MGAGKSTLGPVLAARLGREFVSLDSVIEERTGSTIAALFAERGESEFRALEEEVAAEVLARRANAVVELGGGAVTSSATSEALAASAFTLELETTAEEAWGRVAGSDRPLARDEATFASLFARREPLYRKVADATARDADGAVLAAAGVTVAEGVADRLAQLVPGDGPVEVVIDATVANLHGDAIRIALGDRLTASHEVPAGEASKSVHEAAALWSALRLDRGRTVVGVGG